MQVVYFVRTFMFCGLSFLSENYMCCIRREVPLLDFRKWEPTWEPELRCSKAEEHKSEVNL